MEKQIIRLTESDLHKIIKESVERIINEATDEVRLPGLPNRSMNGNSKHDWDALNIIRNQRANKALANHDFYGYGKNKAQANRNSQNSVDVDPNAGRIMAMNGRPNPIHAKISNMLRRNSLENWTTEELQWANEKLSHDSSDGFNTYNRIWSDEEKYQIMDDISNELKKRGADEFGESPAERDFSKSYGKTHPKQSQIDAFRNRKRSPEDQRIVDSLKGLGLWNG